MLLWWCTEGNSCSLARGCGFPGGSVAQGREEQQDGTERGARESFEPAPTWLGSVRRGGQGALRGAGSVLDVFCVPARTVLCSAQTFQQGKLREHLGLGAAQLSVVPGSPLPVVLFAFCSPWGNPTALGSLQGGLPHRQQPAPAPVAVLGQILLPGPHTPTKRCPAGRAAPPSSRWNDPRGVLPQGLRTQPLHPGCSQPCATVTAHLSGGNFHWVCPCLGRAPPWPRPGSRRCSR